MKMMILALSIFALTGCLESGSSGGSSTNGGLGTNFNYPGVWTGNQTIAKNGFSIVCPSEFVFSQPPGLFVLESGKFVCNGEESTWPRTEIEDRDGELFIDNSPVGHRNSDGINVNYTVDGSTMNFMATPTTANTIQLHMRLADTEGTVTADGLMTRQ